MLPRDDHAQVGIGTAAALAGVVIALTAAAHGLDPGTLVQATEDLGGEARRIGLDAADRFTPRLEVVGVVGKTPAEGASALDALNLTVRIPGTTDAVPLDGLVLRLADADRERWLPFGQGQGAVRVQALRDEDGSLAQAGPVATRGDLFLLDLDLRPGAGDMPLPARTTFRLEAHPGQGAPVVLRLDTPATYGGGQVFTLR
jgi:archaellin